MQVLFPCVYESALAKVQWLSSCNASLVNLCVCVCVTSLVYEVSKLA